MSFQTSRPNTIVMVGFLLLLEIGDVDVNVTYKVVRTKVKISRFSPLKLPTAILVLSPRS